ncbi:C-type lectin domain family 10 member A-like [Hyla sarda]|uniref:C-type lectin domain family 10 member A-like n=1 Tax=Hyla sarda TaxID=327740 RepID=UPI0024C46D7A|nr:C-type lectin domain family 10 member A-like [Hyla sarda]
MDDQELMDLFWNQKRFVVAHWDPGVGVCATSSPVLFGDRDRRVSSNLLICPDVEVLCQTPERAQNAENQIIESNNRGFFLRFGAGSSAQRHLLVGSAVLIVALLAVSMVLLSLYLQDNVHLDTVYKERDSLCLNRSRSMADIENLRENTLVLARNLSSVMDTVSSTREQTLSGLIQNQTEILQEMEIQGRLYQMELQQYMDLQGRMQKISRSYLSIPQESPLLQNCQGTVCPFCSAGWHFFQMSCYLLSSQTRNWQESLHWCRKQGAHLVVIGSQAEQEFLQKVVKMSSWIGLSDRDMEGKWQWVDGTPYNATPKFWFQKQPDNLGNEDCAVLFRGSMWTDEKCRKLYSSVCQYSAGELRLPVDGLHDVLLGP